MVNGWAALDPGRARGRRRRALHLRVLLLLQAGLAPRRRGGTRCARADGRAAGGGVACRRRLRPPHPRLGHARGRRLRASVWHPVQRGPDQEPLRRPHVHPARPGAPPAGHPAEVQPARRGGRQARGRGRRLDRARQHHAAARGDALRFRRCRGTRPHLVSPVVGPCFYGIDLPDEDELVAAARSVEEVRSSSARRASRTSRSKASRRRRSGRRRRSAACLTLDYPTRIPGRPAAREAPLRARAHGCQPRP